jgi:hypothetical protein
LRELGKCLWIGAVAQLRGTLCQLLFVGAVHPLFLRLVAALRTLHGVTSRNESVRRHGGWALQHFDDLDPLRGIADRHGVVLEGAGRAFGPVVAPDVDQVEEFVGGGVAECANYHFALAPAPRFRHRGFNTPSLPATP